MHKVQTEQNQGLMWEWQILTIGIPASEPEVSQTFGERLSLTCRAHGRTPLFIHLRGDHGTLVGCSADETKPQA